MGGDRAREHEEVSARPRGWPRRCQHSARAGTRVVEAQRAGSRRDRAVRGAGPRPHTSSGASAPGRGAGHRGPRSREPPTPPSSPGSSRRLAGPKSRPFAGRWKCDQQAPEMARNELDRLQGRYASSQRRRDSRLPWRRSGPRSHAPRWRPERRRECVSGTDESAELARAGGRHANPGLPSAPPGDSRARGGGPQASRSCLPVVSTVEPDQARGDQRTLVTRTNRNGIAGTA